MYGGASAIDCGARAVVETMSFSVVHAAMSKTRALRATGKQ
jgi:hypothetical protein